MNKKLITTIVAGSVIAYIFSYGLIRLTTNTIVHGVGTSGCTYYYHTVDLGDFGPLGGFVTLPLALVFTPLRWLEVQYWYVTQSVGSPLSEKHRKQNKYASCTNET